MTIRHCFFALLVEKNRATREKRRASGRRRYASNPARFISKTLVWKKKNPERVRQRDRVRDRKRRLADPARHAFRNKLWRAKNPAKARAIQAAYYARHWDTNTNFRVGKICRNRILDALRNVGAIKRESTETLTGGLAQLRRHLESQFQSGWSWENHGVAWEIDHKKPCVLFDLTDPEQQRLCFHFSNCQPLSVFENRSKKDKY